MRSFILAFALAGLGSLAVTPLAGVSPLWAETAPGATDPADAAQPATLMPLLQIDALFAILAEEGDSHAAALEAGMFPGRGGARWGTRARAIYHDPDLRVRFDAAFLAALQDRPAEVTGIADFIGSDLGQRIIGLEVGARRVLLDPDATEAAEVAAEKLQAERAPRLRLIRRLIEAGDLIEPNVAGTMTGLMAFDAGMAATAPTGQVLPEADRRASLWNEEGQIRIDTTNWMVAYMVLAYAPLSDDELKSYVDFFATDAGRALNMALFAGFDAAMTPMMRDLGREAGRVMQGRSI